MNAFDLVVTVALGSTLATVLLSKTVALAEGVGAHLVRTMDKVRSAVAEPRHRALILAERDRITQLMDKASGR